MTIDISIVNKRAEVVGAPVIVCGNSDYVLRFVFDDEWSGQDPKTARFVYIQDGAVKYNDVVFEGDTAAVPVLSNTKEVRVGVFVGSLRTSVPAVIPCELSIRCISAKATEPTPSQYDQIMELLNTMSTPGAYANALKGSAEGNPIRFDDVSPLAHEMAVGLKSKNLLPYPYTATTQTVNGITFTDNGDGTITANGTATEVAQFYFDIDLDLPVGSVVTFSGLEGGTYTTYYVNFTGTDIYLLNKPVTFTFTNAIKRMAFTIEKGQTASNLVFKPQIEIGTTATAYTPFVDVNGASVQKYGKNLLRIPDSVKPYVSTLTQTMENGIVSLKGTISIYGISSAAYNPLTGKWVANYVEGTTISLNNGAFRLPRGSYAFSESQNDFSYMIVGKLGKSHWSGGVKVYSANHSFEVTDDETYGLYLWQIEVPTAGQEYSIEYTVSYTQLELNTTATEYEPYVEPTTYTADENGNVNGIIGNGESMTLMADSGVVISVEYNKDTNKVIESLVNAIISLGGNV